MIPATLLDDLAVTNTPRPSQMHEWWQAMNEDDLSLAYADSFPRTLTDFRDEIERGEKQLLICLVDGKVAGALWLHDLILDPDGTVSAGWIGCYFLPPYRGKFVAQLWKAARRHWETNGVRHFFSAIHVANRRSRILVAQSARFHPVGKFPRFMQSLGQPVDVFIYSLHAEDKKLAMKLAAARASRQISTAA